MEVAAAVAATEVAAGAETHAVSRSPSRAAATADIGASTSRYPRLL